MVKALIDAGADINQAMMMEVPRYILLQRGHLEIVQALIVAGADVNQANNMDAPLILLHTGP